MAPQHREGGGTCCGTTMLTAARSIMEAYMRAAAGLYSCT